MRRIVQLILAALSWLLVWAALAAIVIGAITGCGGPLEPTQRPIASQRGASEASGALPTFFLCFGDDTLRARLAGFPVCP